MRARVRAASKSAVLAGAILLAIAACAGSSTPRIRGDARTQLLNEITTLWVQIRDWRREAKMPLDPPPSMVNQYTRSTVPEAARVCPAEQKIPPSCGDVCNLADAICDNAERICQIADELGKDDHLAQEKCSSAKASCRESKQRCCACPASLAPPSPAGDGL